MNAVWVTTAVIVGLVILVEIGLRFFGFGNPLIYLPDTQIGYLLAPDQQTRRFGNLITINQYSMRSPEISATRPERAFRVLLLGDSIINGGWWTDQANTVSTLLQHQLQTEFAVVPVEVLNASANSWAPRNQLAYLQRFGSFQAQVVVLVINTDDLFATAPSSSVVGRDRNYPDRKPPLAIVEVWQRYLLKAQPLVEESVQAEQDSVGLNLAAIQQIQKLTQKNDANFILVITPLLRELEGSGSRDYERNARQRLQTLAQAETIELIDVLPLFQNLAEPKALYHDHIHLNLAGNQQLATHIGVQIQTIWPQPKLSAAKLSAAKLSAISEPELAELRLVQTDPTDLSEPKLD